jgi:hypothetical protein
LLEVVSSNAGMKADLRAQKAVASGNSLVVVRSAATVSPNHGVAAVPHEIEGGQVQVNSDFAGVEALWPDTPIHRIGKEMSDLDSDQRLDATTILLSLPELELRNLCNLLAREG